MLSRGRGAVTAELAVRDQVDIRELCINVASDDQSFEGAIK